MADLKCITLTDQNYLRIMTCGFALVAGLVILALSAH